MLPPSLSAVSLCALPRTLLTISADKRPRLESGNESLDNAGNHGMISTLVRRIQNTFVQITGFVGRLFHFPVYQDISFTDEH